MDSRLLRPLRCFSVSPKSPPSISGGSWPAPVLPNGVEYMPNSASTRFSFCSLEFEFRAIGIPWESWKFAFLQLVTRHVANSSWTTTNAVHSWNGWCWTNFFHWPPRSSDLAPLDFFLWVSLEEVCNHYRVSPTVFVICLFPQFARGARHCPALSILSEDNVR